MDFWQLLGLAEDKQKEKPATSDGKFFSTKIAPPQKDPKQKKLSENVKKFMQSKSSEQIAKEKEAEQKRIKLLQLRSENKKSQRTMKAMLHMTKSADKSAVSDAKATAHVSGREQCDDDDYGYESNAARAFFEKLMTKYEKSPEDPMDKFTKSGNKKKVTSDLQETKSRVRDNLEREYAGDDKERKSHKTSSSAPSSSSSSSRDHQSGYDSSKKSDDPKKKKPSSSGPKHPPPPSFADLIRMAEEAKAKPVEIKPKSSGKEYEFDRPMTSKEKEEYFREKAAQARRAAAAAAPAKDASSKSGGKPGPASSKTKPGGSKSPPDSSKLREILTNHKNGDVRSISKEKESNGYSSNKMKEKESNGYISNKMKDKEKESNGYSNNRMKEKESNGYSNNRMKDPKKGVVEKSPPPPPPPPVKKAPPKIVGPEFHPAVVKSRPSEKSKSSRDDYRESGGSNRGKSNGFVSKERKRSPEFDRKQSSKPSSSSGSKRPRSRSRSPDFQRRPAKRLPSRSPSPEFRRKPDSKSSKNSKRLRIDSESEYDSEMDDFIDDTEATFDISAEIRSIFGYDRNKYRNEADFDDRSMENNRFADVMREEARSAKLGRMEDLEDMRREEEEKRRKKMKMKMKKR